MNVDFFVSDDIRPESNGKLMFIGLYPGSTIVIEKEFSHLITGENRNPGGIALDQMNITFVVSKVKEVKNCKITMSKEDDNLSFEQSYDDSKLVGKIANTYNVNLRPFSIITPGPIKVKFEANNQTFNFEINIATREELEQI